jgi:hypothetical protein
VLERLTVDLPGLASQQQRICLAYLLEKEFADIVVPIGERPTSIDKAALSIFLCPTRRLNNAVQGYEFVNGFFS